MSNRSSILSCLGVLALALPCLVFLLPCVQAEDKQAVPPPLHKTVLYRGLLLSCNYQKDGPREIDPSPGIFLHSYSLENNRKGLLDAVAPCAANYVHWSIAYRQFWIASISRSFLNEDFFTGFSCDRCPFDRLLKGEIVAIPDERFRYVDLKPAWDIYDVGVYVSKFRVKVFFDVQPTAEIGFQTFVLTNVRGQRILDLSNNTTRNIRFAVTPEERENPRWSLSVFAYTPPPKGKEKGTFAKVETITPRFQEDFQVVVRKDTYYFLTNSGKVYISKKPEQDKERTMEAWWTDAQQPVVAFLTDADKERTFVFTKNKKKDEKDNYFELADKPMPVPYDLAKFPPPKELTEPLKTSVPYAKILLADNKIKVK